MHILKAAKGHSLCAVDRGHCRPAVARVCAQAKSSHPTALAVALLSGAILCCRTRIGRYSLLCQHNQDRNFKKWGVGVEKTEKREIRYPPPPVYFCFLRGKKKSGTNLGHRMGEDYDAVDR